MPGWPICLIMPCPAPWRECLLLCTAPASRKRSKSCAQSWMRCLPAGLGRPRSTLPGDWPLPDHQPFGNVCPGVQPLLNDTGSSPYREFHRRGLWQSRDTRIQSLLKPPFYTGPTPSPAARGRRSCRPKCLGLTRLGDSRRYNGRGEFIVGAFTIHHHLCFADGPAEIHKWVLANHLGLR